MRINKIDDYKGLGKALELTDGRSSVIVTLDVGPRVISVSLVGMPNILEDECGFEERLPDGRMYRHFGGHLIWHNPEDFPRSYIPDSDPLEFYEFTPNGIVMRQKEEPWTQITKQMEVYFEESGCIRIINKLTNNNAWDIEMAVWGLTIGSRSGSLVLPIVKRDTGLRTNMGYRYWPYSKPDDPRVHAANNYIVLDNDPNDRTAFKFGYNNELGWSAYFNHNQCLVMKYDYVHHADYPDKGCSSEAYTTEWGCVAQVLSPMYRVKPGKTISLEEKFYVIESPGLPDYNEESIVGRLEGVANSFGITLPMDADIGWTPEVDVNES